MTLAEEPSRFESRFARTGQEREPGAGSLIYQVALEQRCGVRQVRLVSLSAAVTGRLSERRISAAAASHIPGEHWPRVPIPTRVLREAS